MLGCISGESAIMHVSLINYHMIAHYWARSLYHSLDSFGMDKSCLSGIAAGN